MAGRSGIRTSDYFADRRLTYFPPVIVRFIPLLAVRRSLPQYMYRNSRFRIADTVYLSYLKNVSKMLLLSPVHFLQPLTLRQADLVLVATSYHLWHEKGKDRETVKDQLQDNKLTNYIGEQISNAPMSLLSETTACRGGLRGSQPGSLIEPIQPSALVKVSIPFCQFIDRILRFSFQPRPSLDNIARKSSRSPGICYTRSHQFNLFTSRASPKD